MTDAQARSFSPIFWILGPKRWSSAVRRSGKEGKRARGPFSATRTSWKLKLDGFSSSRGALHDPHHEKAPGSKKPGGRWAAARRPPGRLRPGGAPPPTGPRGRRPLAGGPAGRSAAARLATLFRNIAHRKEGNIAKLYETHKKTPKNRYPF